VDWSLALSLDLRHAPSDVRIWTELQTGQERFSRAVMTRSGCLRAKLRP
jgi:hypothetical protein